MIRIRSTRAASLRPVAVVAAALSLLSLPLSLALVSVPVLAQAFPSKPLRLIVGYPPGGGIDFTARVIQSPLQDALKQSLVIDYKPGAGGTIAAADLTRANADGYTLLVANTGPFAIAPYLQAKMPYDPVKQFTYIGQISQGSYIAVTRTDHPAKDLREFVAWAKANTGKANFASGGAGTSTHLNGELMNAATGLALTHVPYKGSAPAIAELLGGQTQIMIDAGTALLPMIRAGKLRALGAIRNCPTWQRWANWAWVRWPRSASRAWSARRASRRTGSRCSPARWLAPSTSRTYARSSPASDRK